MFIHLRTTHYNFKTFLFFLLDLSIKNTIKKSEKLLSTFLNTKNSFLNYLMPLHKSLKKIICPNHTM